MPEHGRTAERPASDELLAMVLDQLDRDSAEDVVSIALAGKSQEADHMVIASGRVSRHVAALADKLAERLKHEAGIVPRIEGREAADWVLIDAGDVIVHIFRPEVREFYQLEKMWMAPADRTARSA
jgi:ribosome-associated protein